MVWGFCYLRIFKKMHSISGRSLRPTISLWHVRLDQDVYSIIDVKFLG
jgi:hypothetical protein